MHNLLRILGLFNQQSFFVGNELKMNLEAVNLSFIFTWDDGETEDRVKIFTSPLFRKIVD